MPEWLRDHEAQDVKVASGITVLESNDSTSLFSMGEMEGLVQLDVASYKVSSRFVVVLTRDG